MLNQIPGLIQIEKKAHKKKNIILSSRSRKNNPKEKKHVGRRIDCEPEFRKFKFRCSFPKGTIYATAEPLQHEFMEFFVHTEPDFEDLFEAEDGTSSERLGLPELVAPTESESDSHDEDTDSDDEVTHPAASTQEKTSPEKDTDTHANIHVVPTLIQAVAALKDLRKLLNPPRKKGPGHIDPEIDLFVRTQMEGMQATLNFFTNKESTTYDKWKASSLQAAISLSRSTHCAR